MTTATTWDGAPCIGRSWLWDSTIRADHQQAAAECATCPAFTPCHNRLIETLQAVSPTMRAAGGGPVGTWAGVLVGKTSPHRAQCGHDSGYYRHRRNNEPVCDDCYEAHSQAESQRYSRRRMGTVS